MLATPQWLAAVETWVYGRGIIGYDVPIFAVPMRHLLAIVEHVMRRSDEGTKDMTELWEASEATKRRSDLLSQSVDDEVQRMRAFARRHGAT